MKIAFLINLVILSLLPQNSYACRYRTPNLKDLNSLPALMEISENKQYLVKLIPSLWAGKTKNHIIKKRESYGIVFKIRKNGQLQYKWSAKDLYPVDIKLRKQFNVFVSNNGETIVKVNQYPSISISEKGVYSTRQGYDYSFEKG